jgi:hypothetical protein
MRGIRFEKQWKEVWGEHLTQFKARGISWGNDRWREPCELIGASLIYTYNAKKLMPNSMLHKRVRQAMPDSQGIWKSLSEKEPDFNENIGKQFNKLASTMHVASSSFRLLTAMYLIEKGMLNKAKGTLVELLKDLPDDWDRRKLKVYRDQARQLRCCKENGPLIRRQNKEKIALAIILDHRDEFGHGEEGKKERHEFINDLHICRIFEAQLLLAELGVDQLAKMK